jgi:hypothetical protein
VRLVSDEPGVAGEQPLVSRAAGCYRGEEGSGKSDPLPPPARPSELIYGDTGSKACLGDRAPDPALARG